MNHPSAEITEPFEAGLADEGTPFIRNAWYVAGLSEEFSNAKPFGRKILGERLAFYRRRDGTPVALRDRCPHRAFPLSQSTVEHDEIVCGYHGLHYDAGGRCTLIPSQSAIPKGLAVRAFPLMERAPLVWIWMGEGERAQDAPLPSQPWMEDRHGWVHAAGYLSMRCSYVHLHENLLDLSHLSFLHAKTFGTPDYAAAPADTEIGDREIVVRRTIQPTLLPPVYAKPLGMEGVKAARIVTSTYVSPALSVSAVALRNLETPGPDHHARTAHLITPETSRSLHYHFLIGRDFALGDDETTAFLRKGLAAAFQEDVWALEQIMTIRDEETEPGYRDRSLATDKAGVAMRRQLQRLAQLEAGT